MKKYILFLIVMVTFIVVPNKVFAVSGDVILTCTPTSVLPGDTITCYITGEVSDGSISTFSATTTLSDNLTFGTSSVSSDWSGTSSSGIYSLTSSSALSDSFEIASFTVIVSDDSTTSATITVTPTTFGDIESLSAASQTIAMSSEEETSDGTTQSDTTSDEEENPDTGSNIPFMLIGSAAIITVVLYEIATKNKKLHKI